MRKYQCYVCGMLFEKAEEFKNHIIEKHEEGREYLVCKHCGWTCRDLRAHYRTAHPKTKLPTGQHRVTVMYDVSSAKKRRKIPNFQSGTYFSVKNNKELSYRSAWELEVYKCLESANHVLSYHVEPFAIPYTFKGKKHHYYPDILVKFLDGNTQLWEIKPSNQTLLEKNQAKWNSAKAYCMNRGWGFEVITETVISRMKK